MKTCNRCEVSKPLDAFQKCKSARDGLRRSCRECSNHPVPQGFNKQLAKEAKRRYYVKNREEVIVRSAEWAEANRARVNQLARDKKAINPDAAKLRARRYALKRKYGITLAQYEELLDKQNRCCAICGRHESEFKTNLAVDHSHRSGIIRGALCTSCNYRLVARHEDPELLRKIAAYIEQGTEWMVPPKIKRPRKTRRKAKSNEET